MAGETTDTEAGAKADPPGSAETDEASLTGTTTARVVARDRLTVYLAGQAVALAVLVTLVGEVLMIEPFRGVGPPVTPGGPGAAVAAGALGAVAAVGGFAYLTLPVAIGFVYGRGVENRWRVRLAAAVPPLAPLVLGVFGILVQEVVERTQPSVLGAVLLVAGGPLSGLVVARLLRSAGARRAPVGRRALAAVAVLVCVGILVGLAALTSGDDLAVYEWTDVVDP